MTDTNALFDDLLAAYRNADDPDRFLRELLMRLDDATGNAVVATERKLDRLDAAKARLDAARKIARPDASQDGDVEPQQEEDEDADPVEPTKAKPKAKKAKAEQDAEPEPEPEPEAEAEAEP